MPPADGRPRLPGSLHLNRRLSQWLSFHADGRVTITPGKVELGQGILTTLSQIAAEELDVDFGRIAVTPAATPTSPDEAVTSGSLSTQDSGGALRHACAQARAIFLGVVAQRTGVPVDSITVEDGVFLGPAGAIGSYWALADQALLETEATPDATPKPPGARRIAGTSVPRLDLPDKVFGAARYVHDLRLPGMLQARMIRPPSRRATLTAIADGALPGDARVVRDGDFLAVLAATEWEAEAAATRLAARCTWQERDTLPDQASLAVWLRDAATRGERSEVASRGTPGTAGRTLKREFLRPYLAHASIGPSCAVALWEGDTVTVWSHTQGPYNLRADIAKTLRCPAEKVVVRHREGAGCYGHNGADDVALDAVLAARAVPGTPVRMLWSRAEELGWSPFSPAMLVEVEADLDADGGIAAWRSHIVSNGHSSRPGRDPAPTLLAASMLADPFPVKPSINPPMAAGGGAPRNGVPLYAFPALKVETTRLLEMPVRTSALRGLGATLNVWAIESVLDEAAALAGEDPLDFRLRHLEAKRAVAVLERVAAMAGWRTRQRREGWGMGIGFARYKNNGAWAAVVAEVEARERILCRRLWIAGDVGEVVNPDGVANQFEGGAIHGTSVALLEEVRFDRRRITSDGWDSFPILRFSEVPQVAVDIIARPDQPFLGAGEASMAPTIAAIAGAITDALGIRPRALPFTPDRLAAAMTRGFHARLCAWLAGAEAPPRTGGRGPPPRVAKAPGARHHCGMPKLRLSFACTASDRTRPLMEGRVAVPGVDFTFLPGEPEDIFRRALRDRAFDVTELSMGSHIVTTARGDSPYVGVPIFLSRAFRHSAIYIRTDRGIRTAADLAGRTIGLPEYQQTAALWVRGFLREQYGVDTRGIRWRTGAERVAIALPPGHDVQPLGRDLEAALADGTLDALIAPRAPAGLGQGQGQAQGSIARLYPDYRAEEMAWHKATGFFPIMHCLAVRKDVAEQHPWLPLELHRALRQVKALSLGELQLVNLLRVSLPWIAAAYEDQAAAMGGDPWPYGFGRNREEIAAMIRFAVADGLAAAPIPPEALFHPSTLAEPG
ncbi:hypothetical protein CKO45_11235 [Paracraurococcus ruber]|uniref:Aldehyde oxidase/xanthine dehydrogenase a/b hammerhead domain-containing protein n=3 Tax=Paracraurococcus ruber TaxID=77675 RepID=A0ABS1CX37_9PROT|nr:hypothetical protein [Paracraurococcus ruber]